MTPHTLSGSQVIHRLLLRIGGSAEYEKGQLFVRGSDNTIKR